MARRSSTASEEEETPKRNRRGAAKGKSEGAKISGWNKLSQKKEEQEASRGLSVPEFWLADEEYSFIQCLHDEPYVFDGHNVKHGGKWQTLVSQLEMQDHCLLAQSGLNPVTKAAWLILDHRGSWDKDKKAFKWDKPVLKVYMASLTVGQQIQKHKERRKKPLTDIVIDIQRTGSGKQTSYNLSKAFDEDKDAPVEVYKWTEELPNITEVLKPKTDEQLNAMGYPIGKGSDDENY